MAPPDLLDLPDLEVRMEALRVPRVPLAPPGQGVGMVIPDPPDPPDQGVGMVIPVPRAPPDLLDLLVPASWGYMSPTLALFRRVNTGGR